jgi:DDE superfamily endonuclease
MIPSLHLVVEGLAPAFTQPSYATACPFLLAWVMCLGKRTLLRVAYSAEPRVVPDRSRRHDLDGYYNFFERSAWSPAVLAQHVAILVVKRLALWGRLVLLTDDTLTHKCGKSVWGLGWWRDAVASTKKRVATAPGHNWVVLALAVCIPGTNVPILAIPLLARLHQPGQGAPSCPQLARRMLAEVMEWFPGYDFTLVGDGAYACKEVNNRREGTWLATRGEGETTSEWRRGARDAYGLASKLGSRRARTGSLVRPASQPPTGRAPPGSLAGPARDNLLRRNDLLTVWHDGRHLQPCFSVLAGCRSSALLLLA